VKVSGSVVLRSAAVEKHGEIKGQICRSCSVIYVTDVSDAVMRLQMMDAVVLRQMRVVMVSN